MMRIFRVILLIQLCLVLVVTGAPRAVSTMKFESDQWDFGAIKEVDGRVSHTFTYTNTGEQPFVIENVSVSCGCTTPTFSRAPVRPGAKGSIEITFDPEGRPGVFTKEIYVTSNNRQNQNVIKIKGKVEPRPRTVEDDYPMMLTSGLRVDNMTTDFSYVPQGETRSMAIRYINTSSKPLTINVHSEPALKYFIVSPSATTVCAGCRGEITLTYDLMNTTVWGMMTQKVFFTINDKRYSVPMTVRAIGTDDFAGVDNQNAPRMKFSSQYFNFADVKCNSNTAVMKDVTLANGGKTPLTIRYVSEKRGVVCTLKAGTIVPAGGSVGFKIGFVPGQFSAGRLFEGVEIVANDPMRPMRELRISANML